MKRIVWAAMLLAPVCEGVTVVSKLTSDVSASGCTAPPLVTAFATTAPKMYVYFQVTGAVVGDVGTVEYYQPNGIRQRLVTLPAATAATSCNSVEMAIGGTPEAALQGTWTVIVRWNSVQLFTVNFAIGSVVPLIHGIGSAAGPPGQIVAGSIISVYGNDLASAGNGLNASAAPLPTLLNGAQLLINGQAAPLFYAGMTQINAQVPWDATGTTLTVQAVVNGVSSTVSNANLVASGPGIFATVHSADGSRVTSANPAVPGEYLVIYATGMGPVTNAPPTGGVALSAPLSRTTLPLTMTTGGVPTPVLFSGLAPGFAGLYQVNVQVPQAVSGGTSVPMVLRVSGDTATASLVVNAPVVVPQFSGAFNFAGPYPDPRYVNYSDKSGATISSYAYPGQIFMLVDPTKMDAGAMTALISANKGSTIAQLPATGMYWIQVATGAEATFISSVQTLAPVIFAGPNVPLTGATGPPVTISGTTPLVPLIPTGLIAQFDLFQPIGNNLVCGLSHGNAVNTFLELNGQTSTTYDFTQLPKGSNPSEFKPLASGSDIGVGIQLANQGALDRGQKLVVNVSLGAYGLPEDGRDRSACEVGEPAGTVPPLCSIPGKGDYKSWKTDEFAFLVGIAGALHFMPANLRDNVLVVVSAGNAGLDISREVGLIQEFLPNGYSHMMMVGATGTDGKPVAGYNHASNPGFMIYAPGVGIPVPQTGGCLANGTSIAAPFVANLAAQLATSRPNQTTAQMKEAIELAAPLVGGRRTLPTLAQVLQPTPATRTWLVTGTPVVEGLRFPFEGSVTIPTTGGSGGFTYQGATFAVTVQGSTLTLTGTGIGSGPGVDCTGSAGGSAPIVAAGSGFSATGSIIGVANCTDREDGSKDQYTIGGSFKATAPN